ncbi:MAG: ParB N-terminal domain-containing protein [bacterium]
MRPIAKITKGVAEKPLGLKCFDEERNKQNLLSTVDLGIRPVKVDRIVGSAGRCLDFDPKFKPRSRTDTQDRYNSIKRALQGGIILPPVELYKIKDEYYVVDGHHRISVGKEMGQEYVDARIIEFLPAKNSPENALYLRRFDFEQKMGIGEVLLSRPSGYDRLAWQIDLHQQYLAHRMGREISIKDAAHDWFYSIYQPVVQKIEKGKLNLQLKDATPGDIYLYLTEDLQLRNKRNGHYLDLAEAIREVDLLTKEVHIIKPRASLKEKVMNILLPCHPLRKCPYPSRLR